MAARLPFWADPAQSPLHPGFSAATGPQEFRLKGDGSGMYTLADILIEATGHRALGWGARSSGESPGFARGPAKPAHCSSALKAHP